MELLRIYVVLDGVAPTVWRRVDVPRSLTLDRLHLVLQGAMGWTDVHAHEFETVAADGSRHPRRYLPDDALGGVGAVDREATMPVGRLLARPGDRLRYLYDGHDEWRHTLRLEQVVPAADDVPRCVSGARACPPEDCGGPVGYGHLLRVLSGERRREVERFDVAGAQDAIARLLAGRTERVVRAEAPAARRPAAEPRGAALPPPNAPPTRPSAPPSTTRSAPPSAAPPAAPPDVPPPAPVGVLDDALLRASGPGEEALATLARRARIDEEVDVDPSTAARMVAPVAWLLRHVGEDGVPLTAAGYLRPADVAAVAAELDLAAECRGTLTREATTVPLLVWREALVRAGVLRVADGRLRAARAALALANDPVGLWWFLAERVPIGESAERDAGLVVLLELAGDGTALPTGDDDTDPTGDPASGARPGRTADPATRRLTRNGRNRTGAAMHALGWCGRDGGVLAAGDVRATAERTVEVLHRLGAFVDAGVLGRRAVPTPEGVLLARAALRTCR